MTTRILLEACVDSLDHAVAAERGGADRIELCHDLSCGGVTPSAELMRAVCQQIRIPLHALIRPRAGNFCYSEAEIDAIQRDITATKEIGLNGIVVGILDSSTNVDRERTRALVQFAHPLPVTFHRAFDQCPDLNVALETVIATGAKRILTSGGRSSAIDGLDTLSELVTKAGDRIVIMPGGGVRSENVESILQTGAHEIHTSLGASDPESRSARDVIFFAKEIRRFKRAVDARLSV